MAQTLENQINDILDQNANYDLVYSIFSKWLTEEESENELMSVYSVKSFSDYKKIKEIEFNYLELLVDLNETFGLEYVNSDSLEVHKDLSFDFLVREVSKHLMQDEKTLFFLPTKGIFIMLAYDFSIYLYFATELAEELNNIFTKHYFHSLP